LIGGKGDLRIRTRKRVERFESVRGEDERLQTKTKEITRLTYTGLVVELEHLKKETRLIDAKFANAMGEYVTQR